MTPSNVNFIIMYINMGNNKKSGANHIRTVHSKIYESQEGKIDIILKAENPISSN